MRCRASLRMTEKRLEKFREVRIRVNSIIPLNPPLGKGDIYNVWSRNAVLAAVGVDIISYIFLCFIDSKVAFTEDVCIKVE